MAQVLLIVGTGRSGSTLLANTLAAATGGFSAGELRFLWERGLARNGICGCGRPVRECRLWTAVLEDALGRIPSEDEARAFHEELRSALRIRNLPSYLQGEPSRQHHSLATTVSQVHRSIVRITGSPLVVDSSKLPTYALLLGRSLKLDLRLVHLVRDPRATAYSWQKHVSVSDAGAMDRFSPFKSSMLWSFWNGIAPYLLTRNRMTLVTVRYEDLVSHPRATVQDILRRAGVKHGEDPFTDNKVVELPLGHTVAGNPNRMRYGTVEFRLDSEWRRSMHPAAKSTAGLITWPFRSRFGY